MVRHDEPLAVEFAAAIIGGDVERLTTLLRTEPWLATEPLTDLAGARRSPLHLVADSPGHRPRAAETVRALVAAGADVDAPAIGMSHSERPLHWAASNDDVTLADALLDAGADIEAAGSSIDGGPPLSSAVGYGQWSVARRLVDRGARTELWHAAALGLLPVVDRLAVGTTDLDAPLWNACRAGHLDAAKLLVARGASPRWPAPWSGETAVDVARSSGNDELVSWLVAFPS
ncbi:ankyrin repeat domain-containing protein [Micromonospora sp. R77]|uniref:ankyrin repeat domain-containing protein n=1 Tax=Micromonospora sp. R77 TaxID=2925836 RepID=UPI001F615012|nr:ankyrin repeat domain-containing protein [Micromonospora sp. R77]MCI4066517.1 ankyrin repeat domain-containing protein [Micromonospora sp. R77]